MEKLECKTNTAIDGVDRKISERDLDSVISEIQEEKFKGLVCAFDLQGKVLYGNDRASLIFKKGSFFDVIPARDRGALLKMFVSIYSNGNVVKAVPCHVPLMIGRHLVSHDKIHAELISFSRGLVLKIPEVVLEEVTEMELERLKILLLHHLSSGLWITDERGVIVDVLKKNCKTNLGWDEDEVIGKNILNIIVKPYEGTEEVYEIYRVHRDGSSVRTKVVTGEVVLSNGHIYHVYLDTYFR